MRRLLLIVAVLLGVAIAAPGAAQAAPAGLNIYPMPSIYPVSSEYRLVANGRSVPVQHYTGYEIAQFAMGEGTTTLEVTKVNNTTIGAYSISPAKLGLSGTISGPTLTFTVATDEYLIVKLDGRPQLVIAIDPPDANRPASSGTGIFNVTAPPYSAQPGTSAYATTAIQTALNDAAAWGSANGRQGTTYIPPGVWTVGNLYFRSNLAVYLAPGAVLRYTGDRAHYTPHWHKNSQNRDVTWFLSTRYSSANITLYGRGIVDGNGAATLGVSNLGVNLFTPIYTDNLLVEGVTFRESSSWAIMPTRSTRMTFRNLKIFNRFDMGENDGIDVMESDDVTVQHSVAIGLDDPFSTKTWDNTVDLFRSVPGDPRPLRNVVFDDLLSWTMCYGMKVGQGVLQSQSGVTFRHVVVYDAAVGIGIHHKYGSAAATGITFDDIDIERLSFSNDGNRTWLALWSGNTLGIGPVQDVTVANVRVRNAGTTPARVNGQPGAPFSGIAFRTVVMPGSDTPASTLAGMNVTNVSDADGITVTP